MGRDAHAHLQPWVDAGEGVVLKHDTPWLNYLVRRGLLIERQGGHALTKVGRVSSEMNTERFIRRQGT